MKDEKSKNQKAALRPRFKSANNKQTASLDSVGKEAQIRKHLLKLNHAERQIELIPKKDVRNLKEDVGLYGLIFYLRG